MQIRGGPTVRLVGANKVGIGRRLAESPTSFPCNEPHCHRAWTKYLPPLGEPKRHHPFRSLIGLWLANAQWLILTIPRRETKTPTLGPTRWWWSCQPRLRCLKIMMQWMILRPYGKLTQPITLRWWSTSNGDFPAMLVYHGWSNVESLFMICREATPQAGRLIIDNSS